MQNFHPRQRKLIRAILSYIKVRQLNGEVKDFTLHRTDVSPGSNCSTYASALKMLMDLDWLRRYKKGSSYVYTFGASKFEKHRQTNGWSE